MGWRRHSEDQSEGSSVDVVVRALHDSRARLLTGSLDFESEGGVARLFVLDGAPYAAELPGYTPRMSHRIWAAGWITEDQRDSLSRECHETPVLAGKVAVDRGWVEVENLGQLHQEYLLASIDGISHAVLGDVRTDPGATTDRLCTIPVDVDGLVPMLSLRRDRTAVTLASMSLTKGESQVLFQSHSDVPDDMRVPEVLAVHEAVAEGRGVDEIGEMLGLTRAETTYILGALATRNAVRSLWGVTLPATGYLRVPEAFGEVSRRG